MASNPQNSTRPVEVRKPCWDILELDHPDHIECYHCQKLHSEDDLLAQSKPKCSKLNQKLRTAEFIHADFDLSVFRLLMKQHRQGRVNENLLKILSYRDKKILIDGSQVKRIIAEPKIVDGNLLMHVRTIYVVPSNRPSQKYLLDRNLYRCPHSDRWEDSNARVTSQLNRRFKSLETGTAPMAVGSRELIRSSRCNSCPTEFEVSLEGFGNQGDGKGQGVLLFIDKWQDIGDGLSPLEEDHPRVIGQRYPGRAFSISKTFKKMIYESPRARYIAARTGSDQVAHPALTYEDRLELFDMDKSRWVQFLREKEKKLWPVFGWRRWYPFVVM